MPEPMKKVRRRRRHRYRHPPTDLFTSLILKADKRGEAEIVEKGVDDICGGVAGPAHDTMTRNKKRKRVRKQKSRREKTSLSSSSSGASSAQTPSTTAPAANPTTTPDASSQPQAPKTSTSSSVPVTATATGLETATVTAPASSDTYGQAASNVITSNSGVEQTIPHLMDIGGGSWDKETVTRALQAAYNNPERAIDYLYSGIPNTVEVAVPVTHLPATQAATATAAPLSTGPNASPLNLLPQEIPSGVAGGNLGSLDFLRNNQQVRRHRPSDLFTSLIIKGDKRGEAEIVEKGVDYTCGGVAGPSDDTMTRNKKRKRVKKQKEEEPKELVAVAAETEIVGSSGESESKDSPDVEVENKAIAFTRVKKKGESSDGSDDWDPPEELSSKEQSLVPTFVKPIKEPKKRVEAKCKDVLQINLGSPFPPPLGGSKLVFMDNLSPLIQENDVVEFFKEDGEIDWVRFKSMTIRDRYIGYGHVRFHTSEAAQKALKRNGEKLIGHAVKLLESEERTIFDMFTPSIEHKYLFMGNLSPSVTEKDIVNFFVDAGKVVSVRLISAGGHFKGYAHVEFAASTIAHKAIRRYGHVLHGRYVELALATEKTIWYTYTPSSGKRPGFGVLRGPGYGPTKDQLRCECTLPVPGISRRNKNQSRCKTCHRLIKQNLSPAY